MLYPYILSQTNSSDNSDDIDDPYGMGSWEFLYDYDSEYAKNLYLKPGDELKFTIVPHYNNGDVIDVDDGKIGCKIEAVEGTVAEGTYYDYKTSTLKILDNREDLSVIKLVVSLVDFKNITSDILTEASYEFLISKSPVSVSIDFGEDNKTFYTGQRYDFTMSAKNESGKTSPLDLTFDIYLPIDDEDNVEVFENSFIANTPGKYEITVYSLELSNIISETFEIEVVD